MLLPKTPRLRDRAYLDTARNRNCAVPGCWSGTTIGAHIRTGNAGGTGLKPSDDEIEFLCHLHHAQQEAAPGARWWMDVIGSGPRDLEPEEWMEVYYRPSRRSAYQAWLKAGKPKTRFRQIRNWSCCASSTLRRPRSRNASSGC